MRRVRLIRRRTAAAALATFVLAFGTISATGSMGSSHKAASVRATQATRSPTTTDSTTGSSTANDGGTHDQATSTDSRSSPQPVTTRQS
jgi:hypothetical protein